MRIKWRQGVIGIIAMFMITIAVIFHTPMEVQADYNGGQGSGNTGSLGILNGGPAESKTAIAIYIIKLDSSNPKGYINYTGAEIIAKDGKSDEILAIPHNHREVVTKIGSLVPNRVYTSTKVPYPVRWNASAKSWEPNGDAVKTWLMSDARGKKVWENLVCDIWGQSIYDDMQEDLSQYYIIVEPLAWMHPYSGDNGIDPGFNWLATSQGWAIYYDRLGQSNGDKYIQKMTHQALPYSMVLDRDYFGLGSHAGEGMRRLVNSEIIGSGYGIHIIHLGDDSLQTTYDESQGDTPSPAPVESVGQITIVKNYREKDSTTNTYEEKGCYIKGGLSGKIEIEDEISYKVIGWAVSTTTTPSPTISSLTWESSIPNTITSTGTTPTTVAITTPSSCLYIISM